MLGVLRLSAPALFVRPSLTVKEGYFFVCASELGGKNATPRMMMEGCGVAILIGVTGTCVLIRLKKRRPVSVSLILFFPSLYPHLIHLLPRQETDDKVLFVYTRHKED